MEGVFITGTDTNVGKTVLAAGLLKLLHGSKPICYWKPIQTGTIVGDDTADVKGMVELTEENFVEPAYRFADPLAPYHAAKKWGKPIEMSVLMDCFQAIKKSGRFPIIEGAGGLMLPLCDGVLQIEFIKQTGLPMLIVSQDRIGAINQTLLTVNALRDHQIPIVGVVLTRSRGSFGNADGISQFGKVEVLAEFPPSEDSRSLVAQVCTHPKLRQIFQVPVLP